MYLNLPKISPVPVEILHKPFTLQIHLEGVPPSDQS